MELGHIRNPQVDPLLRTLLGRRLLVRVLVATFRLCGRLLSVTQYYLLFPSVRLGLAYNPAKDGLLMGGTFQRYFNVFNLNVFNLNLFAYLHGRSRIFISLDG